MAADALDEVAVVPDAAAEHSASDRVGPALCTIGEPASKHVFKVLSPVTEIEGMTKLVSHEPIDIGLCEPLGLRSERDGARSTSSRFTAVAKLALCSGPVVTTGGFVYVQLQCTEVRKPLLHGQEVVAEGTADAWQSRRHSLRVPLAGAVVSILNGIERPLLWRRAGRRDFDGVARPLLHKRVRQEHERQNVSQL